LKLGSKGVVVAVLQKILAGQGYFHSTPTGHFDVATQAAVTAFQQANHLQVTGTISMLSDSLSSSFAAIATPFVAVKMGATGSQVSAIQKFLIARHYLKASVASGTFDAATKAAVIAFQKAHSIPQTGIIDERTFAAMNGK
jgi:peptidoglycan hydrolase-like protein with peptidoglycan-binding domain